MTATMFLKLHKKVLKVYVLKMHGFNNRHYTLVLGLGHC